MKRGLAIVAVLFIAGIALLLYFGPRQPPTEADSTENSSVGQPQSRNPSSPTNGTDSAPASSAFAQSPSASPPSSSPASQLPPPPSLADKAGAVAPPPETPASDVPPQIVVQNVRRAIRQYGAMFGGNPVGTNPEITSQLSGKNPKGINFIDPAAGMRVNGNGELVDSWGTPLFFHQLSGTDTEIRSAGPDKKMWTADDVVAR